uniref:RING-type E3 ubiquitin transferase n=1 Tax=Leptobrachium leishanense TaxID=445787 RepID=A0A8C5RBG0_9ANUR
MIQHLPKSVERFYFTAVVYLIQSTNPDNYVSVHFYVILSKQFDFNPQKDKLFVMAGKLKGFKAWKDVVCEMRCISQLHDLNFELDQYVFLMTGRADIHKDNLDQYIPYKYVILRANKEVEYEYIYYANSSARVNRCMFIPSKYLYEKEWHQYDDMCLKERSWGSFNVWANKFDEIYQAKDMAGRVMLRQILHILTNCDANTLSRFFHHLNHFYLVYKDSLIYENNALSWTGHGFGKTQLMVRTLNMTCEPFISNSNLEGSVLNNRLVAGLIFIKILHEYRISEAKEISERICCVLCLEERPREHLQQELEKVKDMFSGFQRMDIALTDFCRQCLDKSVHHWIWVLPLVHKFSSIKASQDAVKYLQEDVWAGLEGLEYSKILRIDNKRYLQSMMSKQHLLQIDETLIRSWLCLVSVEEMTTFLKSVPAPMEDVLTACYFKFSKCEFYSEVAVCPQSNILRHLDDSNLGKFGRLVSAVILNAWPKDEQGNPIKDENEVLEHLMQWTDSTYIFQVYGTNSASQVNEEIQELVFLSDTIFQKAKDCLMSGDVQWKPLLCILQNEKQFLDICRRSKLFDVEKVLKWRREEADAFKKERESPRSASNTEDEEPEVRSETKELTIEALERTVFTESLKAYTTIYESFKSGGVTFGFVDVRLKVLKDRYKELEEELQTMRFLCASDNGIWIRECVEQIKEYHNLRDAFKAAKIITELKDCFNLTGDFKALNTLLQFVSNKNILHQFLNSKKLLQEITKERTKCLQEVIARKDFFMWVKETLHDVNELKVFVDLASISAGENDMEVDRVACFHNAVMGYSSLLYDLKPEFGFQNLMQCLEKLWKALENDQALPTELADSAKHIEWLKIVQESHGSVELSSLSLAKTINNKGTYIIQAPTDSKQVTIDNVLRLNLPIANEDGEEMQIYTQEKLTELLNKLMLMSGKGEQNSAEVEKFSEIFDNVQRLASTFIDLFLAGNVLFRKWEATVCCLDDVRGVVKMRFNVDGIDDLEEHGTITELLPNISQTMEELLQEWVNFMEEQRSQHFYLNYYSAEQLVYLTQQFQRRDISEEALVMLSFIKHDCTRKDTTANTSAMFSTGMGRPDKMAWNANLQNCPNMMEKIKMIWEFSITYLSTWFPGHLDIERLGKYLGCLADLKTTTEDRELHSSLKQGRPNLILCPKSEVLPTAIAIYMQSSNQPLPSYNEVLLCTPQTAFEEVALFFRRCLTPGCRGKTIYSLLYADELSYDTAYKSEELFQQLVAKGIADYNLVIICNSDREHCYIPSAFSRHKLLVYPQIPLAKIQQYLQQHFVVGGNVITAASCFKNGTSVGIVTSKRAGVGKSLYVKRLHEQLQKKLKERPVLKVIRLISPELDENKVLHKLLPFLDDKHKAKPILFHIDITSSVNSGISEFLFKLLVLQYLMDPGGRIWRRRPCHLYIIEMVDSPSRLSQKQQQQTNFIDLFPKITCCAPKEIMTRITEDSEADQEDPGMDIEEFRSECFQRPYQYLIRFDRNENLDTFVYREGSVEGEPKECLQLFLLNCGIVDPSWSELRNFTWFLNLQLKDCESSIFCNHEVIGDTLEGFKNFVVNFMILMAKDFSTPSLHIADQSPGRLTLFDPNGVREEDIVPFLLRKKWETEPHPYIFFNEDHESMTFIGFHLQSNFEGGVDAINPTDRSIIRRNIMTRQLFAGLRAQRVPFNVDFDTLPRDEKISKLSMVLGIQWPFEPDDTYELTMDNILKILAIKMRFRCGIPVVIMGETGCGKTRLIRFLCQLSKGFSETENMKLVKVHGGTSADLIYRKIKEAQELAVKNTETHKCDTVLFFDEANTTDTISSIKEALCDNSVDGEPLIENSGLHIIAACNPYRKHNDEMIKRLESAGLGYRVKAEETKERLGSIPLRQLVYRVHALPPSMMSLVWDFGQLNDETEKKYIQQIVLRMARDLKLTADDDIQLLTSVLSASQSYMRKRNDECSFVSLRDVERCMEVFRWFYSHCNLLLGNQQKLLHTNANFKNVTHWCLVLAAGVCYHASLEDKVSYRDNICHLFPEPYKNPDMILHDITKMQDLFLSGLRIGENIARNHALKENVFMMVICIELKIPLFLVGKPGSSKSLAKTIVADAMQGQAAHTELYKFLKQIHLVSFQCSPHSTPEGIIGTFKQCARFQEGKNLEEYVSVVVLDEIGLAEDSSKMPLKTLHPLLEDGCIEEKPLAHQKVGFIGISNWALDPAKMNRGLFVSRGDPNIEELTESAKGICSSDQLVFQKVDTHFQHFANAYQEICAGQKEQNKFFGLRDFYSLIKMVFALVKLSLTAPTDHQIAHAVLRNFSGKDEIDALRYFMPNHEETRFRETIQTKDLVMENVKSKTDKNECRYLLILTKNYAALQILQQALLKEEQHPEIIFGSSFPKDQEYTQICRNISRIKICMETGQMVVLLNLQNLYESLYDALNQYYVYLADQKYVDLGLGTHRVKCRVHSDFRLIVIEEKDVVYEEFPIPLINRLEKHYLDINTVLSKAQKAVVSDLEKWVTDFIAVNTETLMIGQQQYSPSDAFVGYHSDTCASVVLQISESHDQDLSENMEEVSNQARSVMLNCATPDSVIRSRNEELIEEYFKRQSHGSFLDFIHDHITKVASSNIVYTEITTFSRLITSTDKKAFIEDLGDLIQSIEVLSLQQFDTEVSFLKKVRGFLKISTGNRILIIQTEFEESVKAAHLVASAKYATENTINKMELGEVSLFVCFITKLSRMRGGTSYGGFCGGLWSSIHIDDLRKSKDIVSDITALQNLTISQLFQDKGETPSLTDAGHIPDDNIEVHDTMIERQLSDENESSETLEISTLIRSCVQNAIGMLKDDQRAMSRNTRRVDVLIHLLSKKGQSNDSFFKVLKTRLHSMLEHQEENTYNVHEWVVRQASNPDALQEAGTFRQTLWKHLQATVTPILAHLLSIVDCDANLDILEITDVANYLKAMWIFIFSDEDFLNISYNGKRKNNTKHRQNNSVLVNHNMNIKSCTRNFIPFSWRIKDYLEGIWAQAEHMEGTGSEKIFLGFYSNSPLGKHISELSEDEQYEAFLLYKRDFILLTMTVSSKDELELMELALSMCVEELKKPEDFNGLTFPWIHLAYKTFRHRLQNLSRILALNPPVLEPLCTNAKDPKSAIMCGCKSVIDIYAGIACLEIMKENIMAPDPQTWLRQVKNVMVPMDLICSEKYLQGWSEMGNKGISTVKCLWTSLYSMALFIEHVLLDENVQDEEMFGAQVCAICQEDPTEPVSLHCDHIFCQTCIKRWLDSGRNNCPMCKEELPENFNIEVSETRYVKFKQMCNGFFLDLVCTLCFKDNTPPDKELIQEILELLFTSKNFSPAQQYHRLKTEILSYLSPFEDTIDKTPVIRSVILKLLLKYSFNEVEAHAEEYLQKVETIPLLTREDKLEVYLLFVNCLEVRGNITQSLCVCVTMSQFMEELSSDFIYFLEEQSMSEFLHHVKDFCTASGNDWHRLYFIRKLANLHGIESVQKLYNDDDYEWLFPEQMFHTEVEGIEDQTNQIDLFLVCGDSYKCLRDGLGKALMEQKDESIMKAQQVLMKDRRKELAVHMLLAVYREITMLHRDQTHVQNLRFLQEPHVQQFLQSLLNNSRPLMRAGTQEVDGSVAGLVVHFAAVLLIAEGGLLAPLKNLAFSPGRMQNAFLPTMPEDMAGFHGDKHCALTFACNVFCQCGLPMERSRCMDCGTVVGGDQHRPHEGFQRVAATVDRTQTGHVLGGPEQQGTSVAAEREMTPPVFLVLRLLTHLAMVLGSTSRNPILAGIVKPPVTDLRGFLFQHIVRGLEQLRNSLRKSADETTMLIHLVIRRLLHRSTQEHRHLPAQFDEIWSNKEGRNNWEKETEGRVITPNSILNDDRIGSNLIMKIMYDDPTLHGNPLRLPQDAHIHCSKFWSCRERISIQYLWNVVQQNKCAESVPLLSRFLEKECELRLVRLLPEILSLQKDLIKIFHNTQDTRVQTALFIADRLAHHTMVHVSRHMSAHVSGAINLPEDVCENITLNSDVSFLLPCRQGKGLCATALVDYLITLHNSFVYAMVNLTDKQFSVNASDVMDLHVITYEMERDIMPIVLASCQYSVESGQEATQEFDLPRIQHHIARRFLQGKPLISLTGLPTFTLAHDRNYESIFVDIKRRLPQDLLPNTTIDTISRSLNVYNDVCEALHIVDVTLGFLATSGPQSDDRLSTYIERDLQMAEDGNEHILEALNQCHLKHTFAVWQLLNALKSEHLLRLKMVQYKQELSQDDQQNLNKFLDQHGAHFLLLELHEIIILHLRKTRSIEELNPTGLFRKHRCSPTPRMPSTRRHGLNSDKHAHFIQETSMTSRRRSFTVQRLLWLLGCIL